MHLHDVLRLWRSEILSEAPKVAFSSDDSSGNNGLLAQMPWETIPGGLRRDDQTVIRVRLLPALHAPARPASGGALDALEDRLGFELPKAVELLFRLHDGGDFYAPQLDGLEPASCRPLHLLSTEEMREAYIELLEGLRVRLEEEEAEFDDLFGVARRFGIPRGAANAMAEQLGALMGGNDRGVEILPLLRSPTIPGDFVAFVPGAGRSGRVGYVSASSGFVPDHSDDLAFEGMEGWLLALVRGRACRRLVMT